MPETSKNRYAKPKNRKKPTTQTQKHDDADMTQQTPEIAFIHTLKDRILTSSDRNFLQFPEQKNSTIKKKRDIKNLHE